MPRLLFRPDARNGPTGGPILVGIAPHPDPPRGLLFRRLITYDSAHYPFTGR